MGRNLLTALPDDVFDGLTALTDLGLDVNSADRATRRSIRRADRADEALYLNENSLTALPDDVFRAADLAERICYCRAIRGRPSVRRRWPCPMTERSRPPGAR